MPIRQLAPDVAAKIAAGEVVERPASVVKELIENSIDAGSTQIRVDLSHGGLQLIRVTDNGCGIPAEELPLALTRHATSKVASIDDLEHIHSLGFRGEALASIAAVADVTLLSRAREVSQGAQIGAQNGHISDVTPAASPEGTAITVRNLFSAVPARLKFIKSRNTEVSHCHHLLEQYALAYPEIRFSVFSDGRQILSTPGNGQLSSVLVEVYGLQIAEQMVPVHAEKRADDLVHPVVAGYTSRPVCYKSNRQHISFFVNRRWVMSRMLASAVEDAYHSLLLKGRYPIAVINLEIDPTQLDVNVHPAKTEIRFLKERPIFAAINRAVRAALLNEPEMPRWEPKSQTATSPATVGQTDDAIEAADETALESAFTTVNKETGEVYQAMDNPWMTVTEEESGSTPPSVSRLWQSHIHPERSSDSGNATSGRGKRAEAEPGNHSDQTSRDEAVVEQREELLPPQSHVHTTSMSPIEQLWRQRLNKEGNVQSVPVAAPAASARESSNLPSEQLVQPVPRSSEPVAQVPVNNAVEATVEQTMNTLDPFQTRHLPKLRVVGQVAQSYIVTEGEDGMFLIDQHAAHERILLERMVASLKSSEPMSQLLLTPIQLELSPHELGAIEEHQAQLEHIGFKFESSDDGALAVRAIPGVLVKQMNARSLHELLVDLTSPESLGDTETWEERALANVACKAAIKANYFLTVSEMREMLEQLEQTKAPFSCCHGRPTTVHFSLNALARAFERR